MIADGMFVTPRSVFVTKRLGTTTQCHHNFGYCVRKPMIPGAEASYRIGPPYA